MKLISRVFFVNIILFFTNLNTFPQVYKVIESDENHLIVEFNFSNSYLVIDTVVEGKTFQKIRGIDHSIRNPGDPWIPEITILLGVPFDSKPTLKILQQKQSTFKNKFIIPYPEEDPAFVKQDFEKINKEIYSQNALFPATSSKIEESYIVRHANILPVAVSPFQFNPVTRDLLFNSYLLLRIDYHPKGNSEFRYLSDPMTDDFLISSTINFQEAKSFTGKISSGDSPVQQNDYWYNPNKNYFKVYVKQKDVYRLTFQELVTSGVPLGSNTPISKLEMFNDGLPVPIEVFDTNSDSMFNSEDYFQFIGFPPSATPYCKSNIFNLTNVYWFSYQSDSTGLNYQMTPVWSNYSRTYFSNLTTIRYEKDSLYERLGYAPDDKRDFWFWDKATSSHQQPAYKFVHYFEQFPRWVADSVYIRLRIAMQGMLNVGCAKDHKAYVTINGKPIGDISWDGQYDIVFDKIFYASPDSVPIYLGNELSVEVRGDVCNYDDEIRINWIEFDYWRGNSAFGNYFNFKNYDTYGINRYGIYSWEGNDMRIYIPNKNKLMHLTEPPGYVQFVDTMKAPAEYFLAASDYYASVDSIVADSPSALRNLTNGADYIIITHKKFSDIADQLAALRSNNFPDENIPNPRIKIVDVQNIYDEFSFGLLEPGSLKEFVKYAFENWELPSPSYVVLIGDMSYDYRALLESSRPNFIPSHPYFAPTYGQSASDNLIVAVTGDAAPDLAIGRLSIETVNEGNILLQKLSDYPDDPAKPWKQNVLMLASGLNLEDEIQHAFNDASLFLGNNYVIPQGFQASYVFRYPSKPEHLPYQGEGPKIREEINKGAALVNYYGHGGGYQWDLVFTNEDIYLLENEGRLPLILSVTCYTAHFDNQDVFGEQFNKVPGKGSIGFYGSYGLTYWGVGTAINRELFGEIFDSRNYVTGKAIMNSKNRVPPGSLYGTQLNLLTYLGDPVMKLCLPETPDFELKSNEIEIIPSDPIVGDSIQVKINISNWGTVFPNDSVVVELLAELPDTAYHIGLVKRPSFAEKDSVYFPWIPNKGGLYTLTAKVNETDIIMEDDHSDNVGSVQLIIFNISEPNILTPIDGYVSSSSQVDFNFADIGYYIPKQLKYYIQIDTSHIDTSQNFTQPLVSSGEIIPDKSHAFWKSPELTPDIYFWRARIFDGQDYGNWSSVRSFTIMTQSKNGYFAHEEILKTFSTYNINYSEEQKALVLNTLPLPARPANKTKLGSFFPDPQIPDSLALTTITTDGTYLYFANMYFYANLLSDGKSEIYRVGTGNNGTVEGQFYGSLSTFHDTILSNIVYHSDGYLYVAIGDPYKIIRINITTAMIDTVFVPPGLIRDISTVASGPQYLTSDGQYVYNIAYVDSLLHPKYTVRTLDPANGWSLVNPDVVLFGISYYPGFTGFFVHGERIYTCDYFNNYMRRYKLADGYFEEEWVITEPHPANFQSYFAWCNDWQHDKIYASVFRYPDTLFVPKFGKFAGHYVDANGTITTNQVGPVAWWNSVKYDFNNPSPTGEFSTTLFGQNSITKNWDTLQTNIPDSISLSGVNPDLYSNLRLKFDLTDSTFNTTEPMELKSVEFDYHPLSDVYVEREDFNFLQDSLLQGYDVTYNFKARSFGDLSADSLKLNFYLNGLDSLMYNPVVNVPADSFSNTVEYTIDTRHLLFDNKVSVFGQQKNREYFYFNNLVDQNFFVARDSVRPDFSVTFDGLEIINNDIVSSTPEVIITLMDTSPLPLDTSYFTIVHNNKSLRFFQPELDYDYQGPGTPFVVTWKPELPDGRHTLEVLAKDASGNFFDSTSYRIIFYVYNENDITDVYNYPNPFARTTHFTFILKGQDKPDELDIKIYTIAGRLIRDIKLSPIELNTNFNKIYWDGRDEDDDEVGNGVYLYKVIAKFPDKTKTITQKLAKVR